MGGGGHARSPLDVLIEVERWGGLFEADPQERTKPNEASSDDGTSMRTHIHTQIQTQRRRQRSRASWRVTGVAGKLGTYQRLIKLADKEAAASAVPSSSTDPRACRGVCAVVVAGKPWPTRCRGDGTWLQRRRRGGARSRRHRPRLALFTPKQEGCPEETGNTKKSSFPHTPDAAARTPVRLKVCAGARGGGHYPPENSRTGVDCSLSRVAPPPTTVQSLTPTTRASHQ